MVLLWWKRINSRNVLHYPFLFFKCKMQDTLKPVLHFCPGKACYCMSHLLPGEPPLMLLKPEVLYKSVQLCSARLCLIQQTFFKVPAVLPGIEERVLLMKVIKIMDSNQVFVLVFFFLKRSIMINLHKFIFQPSSCKCVICMRLIRVLSNIETFNFVFFFCESKLHNKE